MKMLTRTLIAGLMPVLLARDAVAQETQTAAPAASTTAAWEFNASLYGYFVPQDRNFALPIVTADHDSLHLEGRYNYEGIHTGSVFVGWNLATGDQFKVSATPIIGGVFGDTNGVAPGLELTLSWKGFELYSESEYVIDVHDSSENFFYNWAQLGYSPLDWLAVGLASQRTRTYHTELDVQRGVFVGLTHKNVSLTTYVFNFGWESPTVIVSLSAGF
ncbi:MAG TPA: hypothetical protein VJA66_12735 [Thermoanaerobaculia bacterium]